MQKPLDADILTGSLRKQSYNRLLADTLARLLSPSRSLRIVGIGGLSFYNDESE